MCRVVSDQRDMWRGDPVWGPYWGPTASSYEADIVWEDDAEEPRALSQASPSGRQDGNSPSSPWHGSEQSRQHASTSTGKGQHELKQLDKLSSPAQSAVKTMLGLQKLHLGHAGGSPTLEPSIDDLTRDELGLVSDPDHAAIADPSDDCDDA